MTHTCYFCKAEGNASSLFVDYSIKDIDDSIYFIRVCLVCNAEHAEIYNHAHNDPSLEDNLEQS